MAADQSSTVLNSASTCRGLLPRGSPSASPIPCPAARWIDRTRCVVQASSPEAPPPPDRQEHMRRRRSAAMRYRHAVLAMALHGRRGDKRFCCRYRDSGAAWRHNVTGAAGYGYGRPHRTNAGGRGTRRFSQRGCSRSRSSLRHRASGRIGQLQGALGAPTTWRSGRRSALTVGSAQPGIASQQLRRAG